MSEETLASESDHTSEGGNKTDKGQKESSGAGGRDGGEEKDEGQNAGGGGGSKQEEGRGGAGGGEQWDGAGGSGSKRKKKSGSGEIRERASFIWGEGAEAEEEPSSYGRDHFMKYRIARKFCKVKFSRKLIRQRFCDFIFVDHYHDVL